eukprot:scaffold1723_cov97-Skeletonema_marinoi.AAC.2
MPLFLASTSSLTKASSFFLRISFKLLSKSNLRQRSSAQQWKASRLIEAAHYQVSLTRQEYSYTSNLKERVRTLALAFHEYMDMEKQGNVTNVPSTRQIDG